ncbi:WD40 repeat-like protein, partial [Ramaria rubella]
ISSALIDLFLRLTGTTGDDSQLRIWSLRSGTCIQVLRSTINGPVTDVAWCSNEHILHLLFSCADGTIHVYQHLSEKGATFQSVTIMQAHSSAIEALDLNPLRRQLATIGRGEVKVWNMHPDHDWSMTLLAHVPSAGYISCTVHFWDGGKSVIATFLDSHEIMIWDLEPWSLKRRAWTFSQIGNAAISPDGTTIVVHNFINGVDAYKLSTMVCKATYQTPVGCRRPKQIAFGFNGSLIAHGSNVGVVYVSDFVTADLLQTLQHSSCGSCL